MMSKKYSKSISLFQDANDYFPGGVNSPVRAFSSVNGDPVFFEKGKGSKLLDVDGNEYIDFCCSWGPLILGHAPKKVVKTLKKVIENGTSFGAPNVWENKLANLILQNHSYIDKIRFVSSGTEAVMSALRLARGVTGKNKIVKFEGCYHGHVDGMLVKAGSGLATLGTSSSAGIPESYAKETIVLPLNDEKAVEQAFSDFGNDIAAIIIEPIPANNGLLLQPKKYLEFLRSICTKYNALLIFDEVISGFRVSFEGAAGHYNIQPDLVTFGKIIGGGLPVGAYAGKKEYMQYIAPAGNVYQAGTLSGNPVAMAAGYAQLNECLSPGFYKTLSEKTTHFTKILNTGLQEMNIPLKAFHVHSIFWLHRNDRGEITRANDIVEEDINWFQYFHQDILAAGVYMGPSAYEVGFVSAAHSKKDLEKAATEMLRCIRGL